MNLLEVRGNPQVLPNYRIKIDNPGDTMLVAFGCLWGEAAAKLRHPNIAASQVRRYEFKHYQEIRGKWWTSQVGVTHYACFRLADLSLPPVEKPGYSYVPVTTPNGEKFTLSVSGGSKDGTWTDWVWSIAHSFVGIPARRLARILDAAIAPADPVDLLPLEDGEPAAIRRMVLAKEAMALRPLPRLWLASGLSVRGASDGDEGWPVAEDHRGRRFFLCGKQPCTFKVRHTQVDWAKTGERLGLTPPSFDERGRLAGWSFPQRA